MLDFFRFKKKKNINKKGEKDMNTEFLKGITFDDGGMPASEADDIRVYDLDGNEITGTEAARIVAQLKTEG